MKIRDVSEVALATVYCMSGPVEIVPDKRMRQGEVWIQGWNTRLGSLRLAVLGPLTMPALNQLMTHAMRDGLDPFRVFVSHEDAESLAGDLEAWSKYCAKPLNEASCPPTSSDS